MNRLRIRKMNFRQLFKKNWIHFLAFALFILATVLYFQPQFSGYGLKQHDVVQFKGASNEINHFREINNEEPLWTNSMFGGMPTYQISTYFKGNLMNDVAKGFRLWMESPAGMFFTYLLGFYIMLLCMKVNPKIAIIGAFAFAFSSYYIIILQAGHNTKAAAIGLAPPIIGAFYMAYRYQIKWGLLLSALFMGLELSVNHVQITYYLGILLIFLGIGELYNSFKSKQLLKFLKVTLGLILVYVFAAGINYGRLSLTNDYAKHTIRGGNDITINVDGTSNSANKTSGLDKDYVTQWSYGIDESMTLISPNIKGGATAALKNSRFSDLLQSPEMRTKAMMVAENNIYWGDQPFTSGPVYIGIIVFFLAVLGMIYLKGIQKWMLFAATVLLLMLSWGKNFMGLTDFFLENVPFYNKFRAVTIVLAVVELAIPLIAILFLDKLYKQKDEIKNNIKQFYIASGVLTGILILLTFTGLGDGYLSNQEKDLLVYEYPKQIEAQIINEDPAKLREAGIDINDENQVHDIINRQMEMVNEQFDALIDVRKHIYQSSMWRSVGFLFMGIVIIGLYLKTSIRKEILLGGILLFILIDLIPVNLDYLNNKKSNNRTYDFWVEQSEKDYPLSPTEADKQILEIETNNNSDLKAAIENIQVNRSGKKKQTNNSELWLKKFQTLGAATNYRVYEPALGFNDARVSYFHKAVNGYHGAKLRRIQNVKDFHIDYNNSEVLNMLNVKYVIQGGRLIQNPEAAGNAWLVNKLNVQPNANKELLALGSLFTIKNLSGKTLFINNEKKNNDTITGKERVVLVDEDSLRVNLNNVVRSGISSAFVQDINGVTNWIPLIELKKDTLDSFKKLLEVELIHKFDCKEEAIIGYDIASQLSSLVYSGIGKVEMTYYSPNKLSYQVDVSENQFGVFSEIYYDDGWNAYINGKQVPIHRVDYLLRGIELPAGSYELMMKFEVPKFDNSNKIALVGSLLLFILIGGFFVKDFILKDKKE